MIPEARLKILLSWPHSVRILFFHSPQTVSFLWSWQCFLVSLLYLQVLQHKRCSAEIFGGAVSVFVGVFSNLLIHLTYCKDCMKAAHEITLAGSMRWTDVSATQFTPHWHKTSGERTMLSFIKSWQTTPVFTNLCFPKNVCWPMCRRWL